MDGRLIWVNWEYKNSEATIRNPFLLELAAIMAYPFNMPDTYVLDVIPLVFMPRNQAQVVSYYHSSPMPRGTVVEALFNNRKIKAVVVSTSDVATRKIMLKKQATFTLKKISRVVKTRPLVTDQQLKITEYLYSYYFAPLGLSLKTVLSKKSEVPADTEVLHLFPERVQAEHFAPHIEVQPQCAAGTRAALFVPFANLKKIIIHDEANEFYKSDMTPRYHAVDLAREIARIYGAKFEITDSPIPRLETYHMSSTALQLYSSTALIVDMARELRDANFSIFSRDLKEYLFEIQEKKQRAILYIPRRGHANLLSCQTCGKPVRCQNCSVSLVVHLGVHLGVKHLSSLRCFTPKSAYESEVLLCHHCNHSQPRPKQCPTCGSYALKPHGIGIDKVVAELKKLFTYQNLAVPPIFKLDSDTTGNDDAKEVKIIADFQKSVPAILVATNIILSYRNLIFVPIIGIINADTLVYIPDFRAEETLLRQTFLLGSMTERLIVQTYNPDDPALVAAATGKTKEFMNREFEYRKQFGYPPFVQLVKLTYRYRNSQIAKRVAQNTFEKLRYTLHDSHYTIHGPYPAFIERERGLYVWNILLKIQKPNDKTQMAEEIKKRNEILRQVPNDWSVDVDPKSIL